MLGLLLERSAATASGCGLGLRIMPLGDGLLPLLLLGLPDSKPPWSGATVHNQHKTKQHKYRAWCHNLWSCCSVVHGPLVERRHNMPCECIAMLELSL
jgi:hypothetical protein